jgi:hypothetical protein
MSATGPTSPTGAQYQYRQFPKADRAKFAKFPHPSPTSAPVAMVRWRQTQPCRPPWRPFLLCRPPHRPVWGCCLCLLVLHGLVLGRQPYHWQSKTTKNVAGAATRARRCCTPNLKYAACTDGAEDNVLIAKINEDAIADSLKKRFMAERALRVRSNTGVSATLALTDELSR